MCGHIGVEIVATDAFLLKNSLELGKIKPQTSL